MYIEKLKSGSYRINQTENGHRYRITVDHKPTNAEAVKLLSEVIQKRPTRQNMTFDNACVAFIESKANILSPSTKREYVSNRKKIPEDFAKKHITNITSLDVQKLINDWSVTLAPKTVRNYGNFVLAVLKSVDVSVKSPQMPQKQKKEIYIPTVEDIKAVEKELPDRYKIAYFLACLGLRRSEILALTLDDLNGTTLTINKAMVLDENKQWVIKTTKTTDSTRTIIIPQDKVNKILEQGFIYEGHPANLYDNIQQAQKRAGVPKFKLHSLRHFFASYMHDLGYSDKQIQEMGGWKTDTVMKTVYQHAMNMNDVKKDMAVQVSDLLD